LYIVDFKDSCIEELGESLDSGPIIKLKEENDGIHEIFSIKKQLVARNGGYRFHIYANEHPPPHFHVKYGEEENSFSLLDASPLHPNNGLKKYFKNIKKWHSKNKEKLITAWNSSRPTNCPVGKYDC
jgi:hypothetical protein